MSVTSQYYWRNEVQKMKMQNSSPSSPLN